MRGQLLEDVTKRKKTGFCPKGQVYILWDIKAKLAGENKARD